MVEEVGMKKRQIMFVALCFLGELSFVTAAVQKGKQLKLINSTMQDIAFFFYWGECVSDKKPPVSLTIARGQTHILGYRGCTLKGFLVQTTDGQRTFMTDDAPVCATAGVPGYILSGKRNFINCWFPDGTGEITVRMPRIQHWFSSHQTLPSYWKDTGSNLVVEWEID